MSGVPRREQSKYSGDTSQHALSDRVSALLKTELGVGGSSSSSIDSIREKHGLPNRNSDEHRVPSSQSNSSSGNQSVQERIAAQQRVAALLSRGASGTNGTSNGTSNSSNITASASKNQNLTPITNAHLSTSSDSNSSNKHASDALLNRLERKDKDVRAPLPESQQQQQQQPAVVVHPLVPNSTSSPNTTSSPQRVPVKAVIRASPVQSQQKQQPPPPVVPPPSTIPSTNSSDASNTTVFPQSNPPPSMLTLRFEAGQKSLLYCHVRPQLPAAPQTNRIPTHFAVFLTLAQPGSASLEQPLCLPQPATYPLQVIQGSAEIPAPNLNADGKTFKSVQPFSLVPLLAKDPQRAAPLQSGDAILLLSSTTGRALAVSAGHAGEVNPVLLRSPLTQGSSAQAQKLAPEAVWTVSCPQKRHGQPLRGADPLLFRSNSGHYLVPAIFTSQFQLSTGIADAVRGPVPPPVSTTATASSLALVPFIPSVFWYNSPLHVSISHVSTFVSPTSAIKLNSLAEKQGTMIAKSTTTLCEAQINALLGFAGDLLEPVIVRVPHTELVHMFAQTSLAATTNVITAAQKGLIHNPTADLASNIEQVQACVFKPTKHISALDEAHTSYILNLASMLQLIRAEVAIRVLPQMGVVSQAFAASLQAFLRDCAILVGSLEPRLQQLTTLSLRTALTSLYNLTTKLVQQQVDPSKLWVQLQPQTAQHLPSHVASGPHLLSLLYLLAFTHTDPVHRGLFEKMLRSCWRAYSGLLIKWLQSGTLDDRFSELFLKFPELPPYDHTEITAVSLSERLKLDQEKVPLCLRGCEESIAQAGLHQFVQRTTGWPLCMLPEVDTLTVFSSQSALALSLGRIRHAVSTHAVQTYLERTQLLSRLHVIKQTFFMAQGEQITDFLVHSQSELSQDHMLASFSKTKDFFELAMRSSSLHQHPLAHTVHLARTAPMHEGDVVNLVDTITLEFDLAHPVSLVLGTSAQHAYQRVFRQLLLHRYARTQLVSSFKEFQNFKIIHLRLALANSNGLRQRMIHVVSTVEQYLISSLVDVLSLQLDSDQRGASALYDLASIHEHFLHKCLKRCMLDNSTILEPLMKAINYCVLFADNMTRFVQSINPTSEEMAAALHAFETQTRLMQRQRGVPETVQSENHKRAVRTELKARKVTQILHHPHYLEMVTRFTTSFDQKMRSFITLAGAHAKSHNDVQLQDLQQRLDFNGYFTSRK